MRRTRSTVLGTALALLAGALAVGGTPTAASGASGPQRGVETPRRGHQRRGRGPRRRLLDREPDAQRQAGHRAQRSICVGQHGRPRNGDEGRAKKPPVTPTPTASTVATTGKVFFTLGGVNYVCSGAATSSTNRDVVTTAGHCVNEGPGAFATNWAFVPAYNNGSRPYGTWTAAPWSRPAPGPTRATSTTTAASP